MVVDVLIEVPKGGFVKRELTEQGLEVDYVSPVPSPFNYGCIPGDVAPDGDFTDVIVLGRRLRAGTRCRLNVVAAVRFLDDGKVDDKLVACHGAMSAADRLALVRFFRLYALARRGMNLRLGLTGETAFRGVDTL
jgi:inorganic pyrophosphatase